MRTSFRIGSRHGVEVKDFHFMIKQLPHFGDVIHFDSDDIFKVTERHIFITESRAILVVERVA